MSRNISRIKVRRLSRKDSLKRQRSFETSQLNVTHPSMLKKTCSSNVSVSHSDLTSKTSKTTVRSKQNKINDEGQKNQKFALIQKETKQLNLSDSSPDLFPTNSITNSTTCFDLSITHRSLNRNHRISPINTQDLFKNEFTFDINERNRKKRKNKKKSKLSLCKISICILISLLFLGGFIGLLIYLTSQSKSSETTRTTVFSISTTSTSNIVCTSGGITCSSPIFVWNRTHNCTTPTSSYTYFSCCYQPVTTQLTIQFLLRDDLTNWAIDDVSMTQGNGELIINGGFESNLTGWSVASSIGNLSVTPISKYSPSAAHYNSTFYLHSEAIFTPDIINQTVNVIQGQNINISFYWFDLGGVPGPTEVCEAIVKLYP